MNHGAARDKDSWARIVNIELILQKRAIVKKLASSGIKYSSY